MKGTQIISAAPLLLTPAVAHAQHIPVWLAAAALSPLLVLVLAIVLGFVARSWRVGAIHTALVAVWVLLFFIASRTVENDYIIWTPIILYVAHAVLILVQIVIGIAKRVGTDSRAVK